MPFYNSVSRAIGAANSALSQLYGYNYYQDPSTQSNVYVRNNARQTITPAHDDLKYAVANARWEGVRASDARDANRGADYLGSATWSLSDRPNHGYRADVRAAVDQIRTAINFLYRAQY